MNAAQPAPEETPESVAPRGQFGFERRRREEQRRGRRFLVALTFSTVFHLSMVTVFEIVIPFPRHDVEYYEVRIISRSEGSADRVRVAGAVRTGDTLTLSGSALYDAVPAVALPVLEFAELERLRVRYDASAALPALDDLFEPPRQDSWARFGSELQRLGRGLRDLALLDPGDTTPARGDALLHRPAEGFEASIEWGGPPRDRELLFAPPIKALWRLTPDATFRPMELVLKVDASGRVVNVWSPAVDNEDLLEEVQLAVLQYRFAPLAQPDARDEQSGVLIIRVAGGGT